MSEQKVPSNSIHTVIVIALILAGVGLIYRAVSLKVGGSKTVDRSDCVTETRTFQMQDSYLRGIITKGESFEVLMGYYQCNQPQTGDVVLYRVSDQLEPVAKIVRAVGGNDFELVKNEQMRRWEIKINDQFLTYRDRNYYFGRINDRHPMKKYYDEHGGAVQEEDVIIFSLIPPGIQDSGTFGPVKTTELIGKVIPAGTRQAVNR